MLEVGTWFNNTFDKCRILGHQDDPNYRVLYCLNILNDYDKHFIYQDNFAMCENHYCAVVYDITDLSHSIVTCSGAIFSFQGDNYFNPINIFSPVLDELIQFPGTSLDFLASNFGYYYVKDSRSSFSQNVVGVNCTNDFATCLTFEDGSSFCMGNVKDVLVIHPVASFIIGVCIALMFVTLVFLVLRQYVEYFRNIVMITIYTIPLVGMTLVMNSVFAITIMAYVVGNITVMIAFPLITVYVESFFERYIN